MILRLDQFQDIMEVCTDIASEEFHLPADIGTFTTPIHVEARIRKSHEDVVITGSISTHVLMTCSRCLKLHPEVINEAFEVEYRPKIEREANIEELELDETDLNISYYEGDVIELSDMLREQLLVSLPLQPLCQLNCAGLCPSCGQDLNEDPCACSIEHIDPRLAVLGQLLKQ